MAILNIIFMKGVQGLYEAKQIRTLPEIQRILDTVYSRVFY